MSSSPSGVSLPIRYNRTSNQNSSSSTKNEKKKHFVRFSKVLLNDFARNFLYYNEGNPNEATKK